MSVLSSPKFKEYKKTKAWKEIKDLVYERCYGENWGNSCELCHGGMPCDVKHLKLDHVYKEKKHLDDLLAICFHCQRDIEAGLVPNIHPVGRVSARMYRWSYLTGSVGWIDRVGFDYAKGLFLDYIAQRSKELEEKGVPYNKNAESTVLDGLWQEHVNRVNGWAKSNAGYGVYDWESKHSFEDAESGYEEFVEYQKSQR